MPDRRIVLVCSSGMSTSLLVTNMQKVAEEKKENYDIYAISLSKVSEELKQKDIDVLLLGPQVKYKLDAISKKVENTNIKVDVIKSQDYGLMNGENVLEAAEALMN